MQLCFVVFRKRALLLLPPLQLYDTRVQYIRSIDFESSAERFDCICSVLEIIQVFMHKYNYSYANSPVIEEI